jgi:ABC-type branched-subunit amino acid transport system permease subunit
VHGWGEPLTGLLAGAAVAGIVGFATSFLVVRGEDLTRLMVTLGLGLLLFEAANKAGVHHRRRGRLVRRHDVEALRRVSPSTSRAHGLPV